MNTIKQLIKHFKTISFFLGFGIDLFFLPKITSNYYIYVGPIDIAIVLFFLLIRQFFRKTINKKLKDLKSLIKKEKDLILKGETSEEIEKNKDLSLQDRKSKGHIFLEKFEVWVTYIVSFFLGTLLSHVLVYYFRSSNVLQMWPIFLIVILTILANEFLYGMIPDILLFYIGIVFFVIFNIPIFLNKINNNTFLISILVSVILTSILTIIFQRIFLSFKEFLLLILFSICFPFLLLRLYYINYIPAVPLELGDSNFYSYIEKEEVDNTIDYKKESEGFSFHKKLFILDDSYFNFKAIESKGLYFFSSIISPADVTAEITHVWEKYDYNNKKWVKVSEFSYPVTGGRENGYRGYSFNQNISQGKWRVRVLADERLVGLKEIIIK